MGTKTLKSVRKNDESIKVISKLPLVLSVLSPVANFDPDTFSVMHCEFCSVCGAQFETRRGLSSHARSHLRQLGISVSESSGAPIDLLYQIAKERNIDSQISSSLLEPLSAKNSSPPATQKDDKAVPPSSSSTPTPSPGVSPAPPQSGSPSSVVRKAPISSLLPVSSPLRSPEHKAGGMKSLTPSLSGPSTVTVTKPLWAPQENDAPLNLTLEVDPNKDIVCQLCGAWFETRKGLSSHARAHLHARSHLRQMGITEWSVNGSPIDTLREIITRRGLPCALPIKPHKTPPPSSPGPPRSPLSTSSSPSATLLSRLPFAFARPSSPPQPAVSKSSPAPPTSSTSGLILKLKPEPVFVLRVYLAVQANSLMFGESDLFSCKRHCLCTLNMFSRSVEPTRDIRCEFCGEYFENRKGLSSHARSHLRQMGITEWSVNGSPIDTLREVMHKRGVGGSSHSDQGVKKESSQGANSPQWENAGGAGSSEGLGNSGYQSSKFRKSPLGLLQSGSRLHKQGLGSLGPSATPPAGKLFRMSPLGKRPLSQDAQSVEMSHSPPHQLKAFSPLQHEFSYKRKTSPDKHGHQGESYCELCGFYFENRKALASHARAHLRQFGVTEWCVNGSPIETLSAWMRSRPQKVLEMHRSYMQGNRSTLKKVRMGSQLVIGFSVITQADAGVTLKEKSLRLILIYLQPPTFMQNLRFERRPLKHPSFPDGTERDSGPPKPPRTGTVPALVPKPPSYPLVKLVGKLYTLKCRFCEVEFHGPLSVQEDWIRHLQQHILKMNYNKPAVPKAASAEPPAPADDPAPLSRLLLSPVTMGTKLSWLICSTGDCGNCPRL
uniref:WIZ zinc finger n=1 Tax=Echeneis naucrates TaxID=173247 RepID=A0A665W382_ECHNA